MIPAKDGCYGKSPASAAFSGAHQFFDPTGVSSCSALALLLAGPVVSLPNMLVIRNVIGTRKTLVYVGLVITMATISGMIYGAVA